MWRRLRCQCTWRGIQPSVGKEAADLGEPRTPPRTPHKGRRSFAFSLELRLRPVVLVAVAGCTAPVTRAVEFLPRQFATATRTGLPLFAHAHKLPQCIAQTSRRAPASAVPRPCPPSNSRIAARSSYKQRIGSGQVRTSNSFMRRDDGYVLVRIADRRGSRRAVALCCLRQTHARVYQCVRLALRTAAPAPGGGCRVALKGPILGVPRAFSMGHPYS